MCVAGHSDTHKTTISNAPTLAHTIAETLFLNHAKPLGTTIQAGPNLITPCPIRGLEI